jgi:DNA replication and repair protein RecF
MACQRLEERIPADLAMRTTTSGVHRDKFMFLRNSGDFSDSASTGQFRLMSLLMRLCQASLIGRLCGRQPVLLLDDVLLELDFEKRKRFFLALPPHEQAFFTFLPDEQVGEYADGSALRYFTECGRFHEKSG